VIEFKTFVIAVCGADCQNGSNGYVIKPTTSVHLSLFVCHQSCICEACMESAEPIRNVWRNFN